ncbi:MAG TPA: aminotransferase class III-fold pyridoxal phosphate-dependent enzyme [Candidatus Dormibacteraeota bacterium]|nr:aminotransferase class III-fold pyridoxal phosphate-dependent enzyme [Candidatus Dormibacteraeota bacterium]
MSQPEQFDSLNGVAIIGMAGHFPGAQNVREFWQNLVAGKETISFFEPGELEPAPNEPAGIRNDPHYIRARGVLEGAETFDAAFFGINPREAELMDPQHRVFLETAWEAFEDAGYDPLAYTGPVGVFAGMANNTYFPSVIAPRRAGESPAASLQTMLGNEKDYLATRTSYKLNLRGPSLNIQTACSTSLVAVAQACQSLQGYQCDMAIAGGISITSPQKRGYLYHEGAIVSPDGHCRAFDAQAGGTVFSNGTGIVVLKRLADAVTDHDHIYAVIKGVGVNNDGSARVSFAAPSVDGQAEAIAMAQALAGVDADTITYVETHGTGTALGDPVEIAGLTQAFRLGTERNQFCAIGSVKSNIGHLDAAAGIAGLIKTSLALQNAKIPASLHYTQPNPKISFAETPFYVNASLADWPTGERPRRAGVSAFGSGGTNAHVILEEAPERHVSGPARAEQLFVISARSQTALDHAGTNLASYLTSSDPELNLADAAFTLQTGRRHFPHRRATVARTAAEAAEALASGDSKSVWSRKCEHPDAPVVFLFPGQGAQQVNMGRGLYENEPIFAAQVDECSEVLRPLLGLDLRTLLYPQPGHEEDASRQLKETFITQPALFVVEYALAQLWMQWGVAPKAMIGHSLGEYVAACVAGVFSRNVALRILSARARMMQDLPAGAMLAVRLPEADVIPLLGDKLSIAALNSPGMTVVSGPFDAIDALSATLEEKKIMYRRLATSHAFHSAMLDPMLPGFAEVVSSAQMHPPQVPFVSSLTGTWITDEQATSPDYWVQQVRRAVRFSSGIAELLHDPANILLEVGPGQTLSTLARQHPAKQAAHEIVASLKSEENAKPDVRSQDIRSMLEALGHIWSAGGSIDWARSHGNEARHRVSLPTYAFERQRYWIDSPPIAADQAATLANETNHSESKEQPMSVPNPNQNPGDTLGAQKAAALVKLRMLFSDISGFSADQLIPSAPFLEIGLDSLLLTQASTAIEKSFGVHVTFRQLLEELSSLDALAAHLAPSMPAPSSVASTVAAHVSMPTNQPTPTSALADFASIPSGGVEALVRKQLEIMEKQLEVLRNPAAASAMMASSAAPDVARFVATPVTKQPAPAPGTVALIAANSVVKKPEVPAFGPYKPVQKGTAGALPDQQQKALDALITRYTTLTKESKRLTAEHRAHFADPRTVSGFRQIWKEMVYPIVTERSQGSRLWDVDGNEYVDLTNGFGSILFGHRPDFVIRAVSEQMAKGFEIGPQSPLAGKVAELLCRMTGTERAAFCNTGSEAVVAAVRTARTVTGRDKIAMFTGDYHGIFDEVLARPQTVNGVLRSRPVAPGVPQSAVDNVLVVDYGDPASLDILRAHAHELAAVLVEPIQSRRPDLLPKEFLHELRTLTQQSGTALVFDEIVTGFRVHPRGAQGYFGIQADLATYGKVIGGGLPVGVIAGKAKYMDALDGGQWNYGDASGPEAGMTFFAGTFVRHPLALAACWACLNHLNDNSPDLQRNLNQKTRQLVEAMLDFAQRAGAPIQIPHFASWMCYQFPQDVPYASLFWAYMRAKGIHMWEGRPSFLTTAHTDADIDLVLKAFKESIVEMQRGGFLPGKPPAETVPPAGARLGKDRDGKPAWFVPDPARPGKYLQIAEVQ